MALAYLQFEDIDGDVCRFGMDLGHNRYYAYAVGDGETYSQNGVRMLSNRSHTSDVMGPLDDADEGRSEFTIPVRLFNREHRAVQLMSFRDEDRGGPAVSSIVQVDVNTGDDSSGASAGWPLPPVTLSMQVNRDQGQGQSEWTNMRPTYTPTGYTAATNGNSAHTGAPRVRQVQKRIRPRRPLSHAQFLEGLIGLLPNLLPMAGQVIGSLMGGGGAGSAGGGASAAAAPVIPPELVSFLRQLLDQVGHAAPPTPPPSATPSTSPPAPASTVTTASARVQLARAASRPMRPMYSEAMIAPALLAALPALMPMLQQVLSPQNMQTILQAGDPNRLIGTVSNAIQGMAQLGLQANQQEMNWLRDLNPGVNDPAFMGLLAQMSANLQVRTRAPRYHRVNSVKLHFADVAPVMLAGRSVMAYVRGRDLEFPLAVESQRQIPPGVVYVALKDAKTLEVIAEQRVNTPPMAAGRVPVINRLTSDQLAKLKIGEDYLVCAHLAWKNKTGKKFGTTMTQTITIVGDYTFDSVDESGTLIPLSDVNQFRDYWHKVWQDSFSRDLARIEFECKYYYLLDPGETSNGQIETTQREVEQGVRRTLSRLKAGLVLSPNRLNELMPRISPFPMLNESQMGALLTPDFVKRTRLAARTRVKFGGRPGRSAALWVFPDVKVHQIVLKKADQVRPSGNVIALAPEVVHFPLPALAHFVGVSSE